MSKDFKGWLKYKHDRCKSNYRKQYVRRESREITVDQYCDNVNKYEPPLMDIQETLITVPSFPWNGSFNDMKYCITNTDIQDRGSKEDIIQLIACSHILFEQYKLKKRHYKLDDIRSVTPTNSKFTDFKDKIITDLCNNTVYTNYELLMMDES